MPNCAFLSTDNLEGYVVYDELCYPAFDALSWSVRAVPWRARIDWAQFDLVVIRSCWDYQSDTNRFLDVLSQIDAATRLENCLDVVHWNISKAYLQELESQGVHIVPTLWRRAGDSFDSALFDTLDCRQLVVKPLVSANADHTYVIKPETIASQQQHLNEAFARRDHLVQPFMPAIVDEGEYSLFFFAGELSHTIVKKPKTGDFRVQEEHGGLIRACEASTEMISAAHRALAAVPHSVLYARVDLVRDRSKHEPQFLVMELELIEPSLYFASDEGSAARFATAVNALAS